MRTIIATMAVLLALLGGAPAHAQTNLLVHERGVKLIGHSSEYGGWEASNMLPSLARLAEPGITMEDFVWCTADNAPPPHWVLFEFPRRQWVTTLVFNNALKDEPAYPGISARQVEVWAGAESREKLRRVASFQLERNKNGQAVQIEPTELRWLKLVVLDNWGHPTWTEMNASAAYDDGSRPAALADELARRGRADLYGLYFDFGRHTLRAESAPVLDQIAAWLHAHPGQRLTIQGHTDAAGSAAVNDALSLARARSVVEALSARGADAARLQPEGRGAREPVADNATEAGRARNRRVSVIRPQP